MDELTQDQQRYVAANVERAGLREQAWTEHVSNLEAEERRYQDALAHISQVFRLRTETLPAHDNEQEGR